MTVDVDRDNAQVAFDRAVARSAFWDAWISPAVREWCRSIASHVAARERRGDSMMLMDVLKGLIDGADAQYLEYRGKSYRLNDPALPDAARERFFKARMREVVAKGDAGHSDDGNE